MFACFHCGFQGFTVSTSNVYNLIGVSGYGIRRFGHVMDLVIGFVLRIQTSKCVRYNTSRRRNRKRVLKWGSVSRPYT